MQYGRVVIGALIATAACGPALAAAPRAPEQAGRQFDVSFLAMVEHDTNLPRTSALEASRANLVLDDTTYAPTLNIDARLPVGRQDLFFNGTAGYGFHEKNTRLDSERLDLLGGADVRVSSCQTRWAGGYQRNLTDLQDIVLATTVTDKLEVKRLGLDVSCGRPTGLGATFSVSQDWGDHSSSQLDIQDYRSTAYSVGASYRRPALGTLTLFGNYSKVQYPHRPTVGGEMDGFENTAGGFTFQRQLGGRIEGSVSVSYSEVTQLVVNPLFPSKDFSGVTYSANATYRATSRLTTDLLFERAIRPSNRLGSNYDLRTHYRLDGTYALGKRIKLNLGVERIDIDSSAIAIPLVNTLTNSRTNSVFGGVRYDLSRRLSFSLDAAEERRKTNNPLFDYRDTHVALSARVRY